MLLNGEKRRERNWLNAHNHHNKKQVCCSCI